MADIVRENIIRTYKVSGNLRVEPQSELGVIYGQLDNSHFPANAAAEFRIKGHIYSVPIPDGPLGDGTWTLDYNCLCAGETATLTYPLITVESGVVTWVSDPFDVPIEIKMDVDTTLMGERVVSPVIHGSEDPVHEGQGLKIWENNPGNGLELSKEQTIIFSEICNGYTITMTVDGYELTPYSSNFSGTMSYGVQFQGYVVLWQGATTYDVTAVDLRYTNVGSEQIVDIYSAPTYSDTVVETKITTTAGGGILTIRSERESPVLQIGTVEYSDDGYAGSLGVASIVEDGNSSSVNPNCSLRYMWDSTSNQNWEVLGFDRHNHFPPYIEDSTADESYIDINNSSSVSYGGNWRITALGGVYEVDDPPPGWHSGVITHLTTDNELDIVGQPKHRPWYPYPIISDPPDEDVDTPFWHDGTCYLSSSEYLTIDDALTFTLPLPGHTSPALNLLTDPTITDWEAVGCSASNDGSLKITTTDPNATLTLPAEHGLRMGTGENGIRLTGRFAVVKWKSIEGNTAKIKLGSYEWNLTAHAEDDGWTYSEIDLCNPQNSTTFDSMMQSIIEHELPHEVKWDEVLEVNRRPYPDELDDSETPTPYFNWEFPAGWGVGRITSIQITCAADEADYWFDSVSIKRRNLLQTQRLRFSHDITGGTFKLTLLARDESETFLSDDIAWNASSATVLSEVQSLLVDAGYVQTVTSAAVTLPDDLIITISEGEYVHTLGYVLSLTGDPTPTLEIINDSGGGYAKLYVLPHQASWNDTRKLTNTEEAGIHNSGLEHWGVPDEGDDLIFGPKIIDHAEYVKAILIVDGAVCAEIVSGDIYWNEHREAWADGTPYQPPPIYYHEEYVMPNYSCIYPMDDYSDTTPTTWSCVPGIELEFGDFGANGNDFLENNSLVAGLLPGVWDEVITETESTIVCPFQLMADKLGYSSGMNGYYLWDTTVWRGGGAAYGIALSGNNSAIEKLIVLNAPNSSSGFGENIFTASNKIGVWPCDPEHPKRLLNPHPLNTHSGFGSPPIVQVNNDYTGNLRNRMLTRVNINIADTIETETVSLDVYQDPHSIREYVAGRNTDGRVCIHAFEENDLVDTTIISSGQGTSPSLHSKPNGDVYCYYSDPLSGDIIESSTTDSWQSVSWSTLPNPDITPHGSESWDRHGSLAVIPSFTGGVWGLSWYGVSGTSTGRPCSVALQEGGEWVDWKDFFDDLLEEQVFSVVKLPSGDSLSFYYDSTGIKVWSTAGLEGEGDTGSSATVVADSHSKCPVVVYDGLSNCLYMITWQSDTEKLYFRKLDLEYTILVECELEDVASYNGTLPTTITPKQRVAMYMDRVGELRVFWYNGTEIKALGILENGS